MLERSRRRLYVINAGQGRAGLPVELTSTRYTTNPGVQLEELLLVPGYGWFGSDLCHDEGPAALAVAATVDNAHNPKLTDRHCGHSHNTPAGSWTRPQYSPPRE